GLTKFSTASDGSTNTAVTFPNKSRNLGHVVLHEAMHFYVNENYRSAAEARKDRLELMEGGAEYLARIVIQSQLSADPDFEINFSTYRDEFSYINNMSIATKVGFPVLYFGGRIDLLPLPPSGS